MYVIPITVFAIEQGSLYYLTWVVFGHVAGVYSPASYVIIAGFLLHIFVATSIGIIAGLCNNNKYLFVVCYAYINSAI